MEWFLCGPSGGFESRTKWDTNKIEDNERISKVTVWHGGFIDAIMLTKSGPSGEKDMDKHGGKDGTAKSWDVVEGNPINRVIGRWGGVVEWLRMFNDYDRMTWGKENESKPTFEYVAPSGFEIIGFWGYSNGVYIDSLGVQLRRCD